MSLQELDKLLVEIPIPVMALLVFDEVYDVVNGGRASTLKALFCRGG